MIRLKQWLLVKPVDINNFEVCRLVLPRSPVLQVDSLPAEPQGKPKDTGVGSLSLLQGAFLTQEFEPGSPALQADSLPAEPPGKPCITTYFSHFSSSHNSHASGWLTRGNILE